MTTQKPVWAITDAMTPACPDDPSNVVYLLTFNGERAAELTVSYDFNGSETRIKFDAAHEGNDGAWVMCRALNALYDNQEAMRESTGVETDFEFPYEAFQFLGRPLEFTY